MSVDMEALGFWVRAKPRRRGRGAGFTVKKQCWLWTGAKSPSGYGCVTRWVEGRNVTTQAHRRAWELVNGSIPSGFEVDHLCRTRACVNPEHLELVSHQDNVARGRPAIGKATRNGRKTVCSRGHQLSGANLAVHIDRHTGHRRRICRTCRKDRAREWRAGVTAQRR